MQTRQHSGRASKGSQFHLQNLVNDLQNLVNGYPEYLNCLILSSSPSLRTYAATHPKWVSPLASDNYMEYRDERFLEAIGFPQLSDQLYAFWPLRGPVWDALATVEGKNGSEGVVIVEAKSHIPEISGQGCKAESPESRAKIGRSLATVKQVLGVKPEADWMGEFYQYANRLAHLYFLNVIAQISAWMVFLYFVGDVEQNGPSTVIDWLTDLDGIRNKLGLPQHHLLDQRVVSVFAPVRG
ncbi:MAG: hypothetical protein E3J21_06445 [Anaerolineales bacterium]|nr:MAG: hypothetical protein E3J21_06445 [Anaerolineales bacterium]